MFGWRSLFLVAALLGTLSCGKRDMGQVQLTGGSGAGHPSADEAGRASYRYAFSAQVLDETTGLAVPNFAVTLLSQDGAVSALLNAMGDKTGVFHISRNPAAGDLAFKAIPILLTAVGHKPVVQFVDVGADCLAGQCPGSRPLAIHLAIAGAAVSFAKEAFAPLAATQKINAVGTAPLFQALIKSGKMDPEIQKLFSTAKNGDTLSNILIVLNGSHGGADLAQALLNGANAEKLKGLTTGLGTIAALLVPMLSSSHPDASAAMIAVNALLPYLTPILQKAENKGPLMSVLTTLLADPNSQQNLVNLIQSLSKNGDKTKTLQFAMATFLPLLQSLIAKKVPPATASPFETLLAKSVLDPKFAALVASLADKNIVKDEKVSLLLSYLQPLVQALSGKAAPEIAYLFNQLIQDGGLQKLKDFAKDGTAQEKFAQLIPYIEPLVKGLNSAEATKLAEALLPILASSNPAAAVRDILVKAAAGGSQAGQVIAALLPALEPLLKETSPGKQVLSAQLLQGLLNGDFTGIQVTKDLQGLPAVIVSGQAKDIFKLLQLPNVDKAVALTL